MKPKRIMPLCVIAATMLLAGCTTMVSFRVTRPAELDLRGAKSIAVLPIGLSTQGADTKGMSIGEILLARLLGIAKIPDRNEAEIATAIESEITKGLINAQFMRVVPSDQVAGYLQKPVGTPPVDVYLTGEITSFSNKVEREQAVQKIDGKDIEVTEYRRYVDLSLLYQVIDARSKEIVAFKTRDFHAVSPAVIKYDEIDPAIDVMRYDISGFVSQVLRELQPYVVTRYVTLLKDETHDPAMKAANQLVKDGFIQKAYDQYTTIYRQTGNFAAGYNAAMLAQALGNLDEALKQMKALADATLDKRALRAQRDIEAEIASAERLQQQTGK